jgi:hypothetical protein
LRTKTGCHLGGQSAADNHFNNQSSFCHVDAILLASILCFFFFFLNERQVQPFTGTWKTLRKPLSPRNKPPEAVVLDATPSPVIPTGLP